VARNARENSVTKCDRPVPVILCGGSGTRLWPLSTADRPKQFVALVDDRPMLVATIARVADTGRYADPLIVTGHDHAGEVRRMADLAGRPEARLVLEPVGRNTAPAAVAAALIAGRDDPSTIIALLPADHVVGDPQAFHAALARATAAARAGRIVTIGIEPDRPETGYGYIRLGAPVAGLDAVCDLDRFVEKPDAETAAGFLETGGHVWNAGIFVARADVLLDEATRHAPDIVAACRAAIATDAAGDIDLDAGAFADAPSVAFDVAVMERTDRGAVVPAEMGWSDVGSWQAVWRERKAEADAAGNVAPADTVLIGSRDCLVAGEGGRVALVEVEGLAVIRGPEGLLICPLDRSQEARQVADRLAGKP
jgi:mannose-1-phosphate guanylyltransferase/mannose-1-phosphate guanylyltransferase/mannose-6-phosphate isomerase